MPALPGALEVAARGERTGGDRRNREFAGPHVRADGVPDELLALGFDPQTAGGLLVAIARDRAPVFEAHVAGERPFVRRIGRVDNGAGVAVQ